MLIKKISKTRYLGIFDSNLMLNCYVNNLVGRYKCIFLYKLHVFVNLKDMLPLQIVRLIYFAFYQSIC